MFDNIISDGSKIFWWEFGKADRNILLYSVQYYVEESMQWTG